jgi:hypothetical protein
LPLPLTEPHASLQPASRTAMAQDPMVHRRLPRAQAQLGADGDVEA